MITTPISRGCKDYTRGLKAFRKRLAQVPSLSSDPGWGCCLPTEDCLRPGCAPWPAEPGAGPGHSSNPSAGNRPALQPPPHHAGRPHPGAPFKNHFHCCEQDQISLHYPQRPRRPHAAMASKGLQDLKQQVEGAAQDAVTSAGAAVQQVVDQATDAGQKAMDQVAKSTQETIDKTANQASETFSGFGKKLGLLK